MSESHKMCQHYHEQYQMNSTLASRINDILIENDWPKGFGKDKKDFKFGERLFTGN